MFEGKLQQLGLTKNEEVLYLYLVKEKRAVLNTITKETGLYRTNAQDALNRLNKRGLIAEVKEGKNKYFEAAAPTALRKLLDEKQQILDNVIPSLQKLYAIEKSESEALLFKGLRSCQESMLRMLEQGKTMRVFGVSKSAPLLSKGFLSEFHKERIKKKVEFYHIYNTDAIKRAKWLNTLPYTYARVLDKQFDVPVATRTNNDEVHFIMWARNGYVIQIRNGDVAKSYAKYFSILWKIAKEP